MSIELFECSCHAEGISLEKMDGEIYICIWERGYRPEGLFKLTFKERLKSVWGIITKGHLYNDQIIMSHDEALKFGQRVQELAKIKEKNDGGEFAELEMYEKIHEEYGKE